MQATTSRPTFHVLLDHLRQRVSGRIASGEVTERSLARLAGISQPHLHNVLKGIRTMTPDIADRLMSVLRITVIDLSSAPAHPKAGSPTHQRD